METKQYLELILKGYFENPKLFKEFLIRNQKIVERDFFVTKDEFQKRCNEIVISLNRDLENSLYSRKRELYQILEIEKSNGNPIDEIKTEIKEISKANFSIYLQRFTNGTSTGHLWLWQILEIENAIKSIFVIKETETLFSEPQQLNRSTKDLTIQKWFKTGIALATGEAFEIYRKLGANNPTEICRKINVPTSNKTYVSSTLTDKDDNKNLFNDKEKLKALHKEITEKKLKFGDEFLKKYNQIEPE